jgi:hypothetical protein
MRDEIANDHLLHYTVDRKYTYPGLPDLDAETGTLQIPDGPALQAGVPGGWKRIIITPGPPTDAGRKLTEQSEDRAAKRRRLNPR